jgi:hypothetical protein
VQRLERKDCSLECDVRDRLAGTNTEADEVERVSSDCSMRRRVHALCPAAVHVHWMNMMCDDVACGMVTEAGVIAIKTILMKRTIAIVIAGEKERCT